MYDDNVIYVCIYKMSLYNKCMPICKNYALTNLCILACYFNNDMQLNNQFWETINVWES